MCEVYLISLDSGAQAQMQLTCLTFYQPCILLSINRNTQYKYYVSGHYPLSYFYLKHRPVYISKHLKMETESSLRNVLKYQQDRKNDNG
jgi:Gpi18-like mannosyltransferase